MSETILRPATPSDAEALAALHVAVWRETYRHLAPSEAYAALDESHRLAQWRAALAAPPPVQTFVLETGGEVLGLVSVGAPGQAAFGDAGELRHLYLAPALRGRKYGRLLLHAGLCALHEAGFAKAALAVVEENHAARAFYARAGGCEGARFIDQGPLWRSHNLVVHFELPPKRA